MAEQKELKPDIELVTSNGQHWFRFSADQTGLDMVGLEDRTSGIVVTSPLANPNKRTAAHKAWGGARQSRAPGTPWEIYHEMGEKGVDPDAKIDDMFAGYGHRSVGDEARIQIDHHLTPMHLAYVMFNEGYIISGQEKSTRYQSSFRKAVLHPLTNYLPEDGFNRELEEDYQGLGQLSLELFAKHRERLTSVYHEFYQPDTKQQGALASRVLDSARYFLLFGQGTGFSFETSARDWSRIVSLLKASHVSVYRKYADQLEAFLAPSREQEEELMFKAEAPSLIRHTQADQTVNENLRNLKEFIEPRGDLLSYTKAYRNFPQRMEQTVNLVPQKVTLGERVIMQYLLTLWPGLPSNAASLWLSTRDDETKQKLSQIVFAGHDKYQEPSYMAAVTGLSLEVFADLGVQRDFNRQRAWGRFMPLPLVYGEEWSRNKSEQILCKGFGLPLYLSKIDEFKNAANEFSTDMNRYYEGVYSLLDRVQQGYGETVDFSFVTNVMPLAQMVDLYMHGNPKQALYFTDLRYRPGGHINYRSLAYDANQLIADSDLYLSGMRLNDRPDPASRKEFFDRS